MAVSDATWLDQAGHVRLVGQLSGDFGGLPTGWTEDAADPANVSSEGGNLALGGGELQTDGGDVVLSGTPNGSLVSVDDVGASTLSTDWVTTALVAGRGKFSVFADDIGFYSATPVAQPAAPVTLGDVIAALQALGLVAT